MRLSRKKGKYVRGFLWAVAAGAWGLGVTIATQKGWLNQFPDLGVSTLFIAPIFICIYLAITHETAREYHYLVRKYRAMSLLVFIVGGAAVGALVWYAIYRLPLQQPTKPRVDQKEIPAPLLASQIEEIKRLQEFIGGKSETELRELFDIPGMMKFNIRLAKSQLAPTTASREEISETDTFFREGRAIWTIRNGYSKLNRDANGNPHYEAVPGKTGLLNISKKRITNEDILKRFESSAQLPVKIREALRSFRQVLSDNMDILFDVINERFAEDPRNITEAEDKDSPFYAATWGEYCHRFIQLEPKRDAVLSAIREYLRVNGAPEQISQAKPETVEEPFELHDLFVKDFDKSGMLRIGMGTQMEGHWPDGTNKIIGEMKLFFDFQTKSKFLAYYFLPSQNPDLYMLCRNLAAECKADLTDLLARASMKAKDPAQPFWETSEELVFTGKVYVYYEGYFSIKQLAELEEIYKKEGLSPQFRGLEYATMRRLQSKSP